MKTNARKVLFWLAVSLACLTLFGCGGGEDAAAVSAEAVATAEPVIISIDVVDQDVANAQQAPVPTPTPEPTPTPVPFSHYAPTVNMTYEELVGSTDDLKVKAKELLKNGYPDPKTYYIIVDKQWQVTMVFERLDDGSKLGKPNYEKPVRYMICSTGNPKKEYGYETMSGIWPIEAPKARFHQFVNMEAAQYLTLIHSLTYFHSILYEKIYDLDTLVQATYDILGTRDSHSCIRLTVPDARWMFYNIAPGTTCEIRNGSPDDKETQAIRAQLILPSSKSSVKLRPSEYPWTDNWQIADVPHEVKYTHQELPKPEIDNGADPEAAGVTPTPDAGGTTGGVPDGGAVTVTPAPAPDPFTPSTTPPEADPQPEQATEPPRNDEIGDVEF